MILQRDFPKAERHSIGRRINDVFLEVLEISFTAIYFPPEQKVRLLSKAIGRLDILKFFLQLAWESKLIHTERYVKLSQGLEEIGRMLGGWKRGLDKKLSQQ